MKEPHGTQNLGSMLDSFLGRKGLGKKHKDLELAREAWLTTAGEDLSGHTRIRGLRAGVLTIDVDSAPLCHRLSAFDQERLLASFLSQPSRPHVTALRFRLGAFS